MVNGILDTGAQVSLISQHFALRYSLVKISAQLPNLQWLGQQRTACYSAYEFPLRMKDSQGTECTHTILAYGADLEESDLLLGRHTLSVLGIDISNGSDTWE